MQMLPPLFSIHSIILFILVTFSLPLFSWFLIQCYFVAALACIPDWDVTFNIASSIHFRALAIFPIHDAVSLPDFSFRLLLLSGSSIHIILDWTLYMQCLAICYCSFWHSGVYSLISEHLSADLSFGLLLLA